MKEKKRFKIRHLLLLLFFIYVISTLITQQFRIAALARQEALLKNQMKNALDEREQLKKEISLLHTDNYIEKVARDELGLVKEGEYIYKGVKESKN